jgi:hypothetical protein
MVDPVLVLHVRDENHLGVAPAHLLQGLQVSDLHRGLAVEFVSSHPHQLGCFDVGTGRDNLAFGQPPLLGSRRQRILEIFAQLDILDENLFDLRIGLNLHRLPTPRRTGRLASRCRLRSIAFFQGGPAG